MTRPRLHRLANGLTVAVAPMAGVETLALGLYVDVGGRNEPGDRPGLAHMVEHMVFKGAGGRSAREIAEAIEDVGGALNAYTARDHTVFHARLLPGDLALGVELIADLVRAPDFAAEELVRERAVVLAELGEARDTPDDILMDHLQSAAYPDQPFGHPILGDETSIAAIATPDLRSWIERLYQPDEMVVAAAGKLDEDRLLALVEGRFGDLVPGRAPPVAAPRFHPGTHHDLRRFDQLHLAFAVPGVAVDHPDHHALTLFAGAAGGGMSSRLFQELRETRGLAYSVYAWNAGYADAGTVGVYLATARRDGGRALKLAREVLVRTAAEIDEPELARARAQARAGLLMGLESVQARCDHLARNIQVHGRIVAPAETVAAIDAVTVAQLRSAAETALAGGEALASVGGRLARAA